MLLSPARSPEHPCTGAVPKAEPHEAETPPPPPPMPGAKQPTAKVPSAFTSSPATPAGGISELTKPAQPLFLFPFGFRCGQAAGPGERGRQGSKYSQSLCLHTSGCRGLPGRGHLQLPPQPPALLSLLTPEGVRANLMCFPLLPQRGSSVHDAPHCCYPPCQPVTSAVPTPGTPVPTHRTLKVVPTPPLAAFTGLIISFILETPLPHFCSASGALRHYPGLRGHGTPQPRRLPAAPKRSLCSFLLLHHHQTGVCKVLHIHRQRTHCGPIYRGGNCMREGHMVCAESSRREHRVLISRLPKQHIPTVLNCPSCHSFAQEHPGSFSYSTFPLAT